MKELINPLISLGLLQPVTDLCPCEQTSHVLFIEKCYISYMAHVGPGCVGTGEN